MTVTHLFDCLACYGYASRIGSGRLSPELLAKVRTEYSDHKRTHSDSPNDSPSPTANGSGRSDG